MSLKDSIREAREKTIEEGGNFSDWLHGIEFVKSLGGLAVLAAICVGIFVLLPIGIREAQHALAIKYCKCENIDPEYGSYDYENKLLVSRCDFCHRPKNLQATVEDVTLDIKSGCIYEGFRMEVWTYSELPDFKDYVAYNTPPTNHKIGDVLTEGFAPTCSTEGLTDSGYCAYCQEFVEAEPIPKLEHTLVVTEYITPTCISVGYEKGKVCSECDYVAVAPKSISKTSHNMEKGIFEATYENGSFEGEKCKDCGHISKVKTFISEPLISDFLDYEIVDNKCVITNIKVSQEHFVIPDYINGYLVVELAEGLFKDDATLKTISLPSKLSEIKNDTFNGCSNLKSIVIPDSVTAIGARAFNNCTSLKIVDLGKGVENVRERAFDNCNGILSFKFSPNIDYSNFFKDNVFPIFPYNRKNYSECYFSIPVLYIPESMRNLAIPNHEHLFYLPDTNNYVLEEEGYYFFEENGCKELLGFDKELIKNDTLIVPDKTDILGGNFFYNNELFLNIVLPRTVYKVENTYRRSYPNSNEQKVNIYYLGAYYELNFVYFGRAELASQYTDNFWYYKNSSEGWYFDENGIPTNK